ncbi:MAG TPA: Hpt domain-containing protein, partial [Candidatus Binatia bacterium]
MNLDPVLEGFLEEAGELLTDFEAALLELEGDPTNLETLNRIFRCAHTLKGNSGMLGMDAVAGFTHVLEDLLDRLRRREIGLSPPLMDMLLKSLDALKELLADARAGKFIDRAWHEQLLQEIQSFSGAAPAALESAPAPASETAETLYEIYFAPPLELMRRGLDPLQFLQALAEKGRLLQVTPDLGQLPPLGAMEVERCYLRWTIWLSSGRPKGELEACFDFLG